NTEQERQLGVVQRSGEHLLSIINDLLDLAKIESGRVELVLEQVDCVQAVASVVGAMQPLAIAKGLTLTSLAPSTPVFVPADARALGQILINLVNNAIKFTDIGGITVDVDSDADGAQRITVSDTGAGIPSEGLSRIFEAFERGARVDSGRHEGTGLGLSICQKLGELMHATITVDSSVGVGSTFAVVFAPQAS
ncbi:MAG: HAMP domain-containing sensor histidine kinase, partial [Jatrophihabitantaceae bacterium]